MPQGVLPLEDVAPFDMLFEQRRARLQALPDGFALDGLGGHGHKGAILLLCKVRTGSGWKQVPGTTPATGRLWRRQRDMDGRGDWGGRQSGRGFILVVIPGKDEDDRGRRWWSGGDVGGGGVNERDESTKDVDEEG